MGERVEDAGGEAGFVEARDDGPCAAGGDLGGFEDGGVTGGESVGDGTDAEDVGCVPGAGLVAGRKRGGVPKVGKRIEGKRGFTRGQWRG